MAYTSRTGRRRPVSKKGITRTAEEVAALVAACTASAKRESPVSGIDPAELRAEVILRLRSEHHCTWMQIGDALGITGERARQLSRNLLRARARSQRAKRLGLEGATAADSTTPEPPGRDDDS